MIFHINRALLGKKYFNKLTALKKAQQVPICYRFGDGFKRVVVHVAIKFSDICDAVKVKFKNFCDIATVVWCKMKQVVL